MKKHILKLSRGFTLTELLIVIAIIGLLAGIVLASINRAREKALIAKTVLEVKEMTKSLYLYYSDTGVRPVLSSPYGLTEDPLQNSLGVSGWKGPYGTVYDKVTAWGGSFGPDNTYDLDGGGDDYVITLNDDRPLMGGGDNGALIPLSAMLEIDRILDDGNLATGDVRGNGLGFEASPVAGEVMIKLRFD